VNNAGFGQMAMFEDTSEELFDAYMRVILKGPYFLPQTLLPMLEDGGAIVNTTSNSALFSGLEPGYSAYGSMKGGLLVLTAIWRKNSARAVSASTRWHPDPRGPVSPRTSSTRARPGRGRPGPIRRRDEARLMRV